MAPRRLSGPTAGALACLTALAVGLPIARGGVDVSAQLAAVVLAGTAAALAIVERRSVQASVLALLAVAVVMLTQLVPVPAGWHALSPRTRDLFAASLGPLGIYPAARPLSLDPPATARELGIALACVCAFAAATAFAEGRRSKELAVRAIAVGGVATAAGTLVLALLGVQPLLAPSAPFVNPNHLGGFLCLGAFATLGAALHTRGQERALWIIAFVPAVAVLFLSLSRGAIGAFFAGVAIFVSLLSRRRQDDAAPVPSRRAALAAVLATALGTAMFLALDPVVSELKTLRGVADDVKIQLWPSAVRMIRDRPLLGIGRGAFETAFAGYKVEPTPVTFTHLENEWIQPFVDHGIAGGLLLVATVAWIWLREARRRDLSSLDIGLLAGTAALVLHDAVDFSLEMPGVAIPFAIALGLLARGGRRLRVRPAWAGLAGALAAVGVGAILFGRAHRTEVDALAPAGAADANGAAVLARDAARYHPADYVPQATAGVRLVQEGRCADGLRWLTRAMALDPTAPEPHLYAARCLAAGALGVLARREYRLAYSFGRADALDEASRRFPKLEDLLEVAPASPDGLVALGELLMAERPLDAAVAFRHLVEDFRDERGVVPLGTAYLRGGELAQALALGRRHEKVVPRDPAGWDLAAWALELDGRRDEADAELAQGLAANPGSLQLVQRLVERALATRHFAHAKRLVDEAVAVGPRQSATKLVLEARALAGLGRFGEAVERAERATDLVPDGGEFIVTLASMLDAAGRYSEAIDALERAKRMPRAPDSIADRIAEIRGHQSAAAARRVEDTIVNERGP